MEFGLRGEIVEKIRNIVNNYKYKFKIFGSRAKGNYRNNSDIDIAIFEDVNEEDEYKIRNEFDLLDIQYTIDLVFVTDTTKKELLNSILNEGVDL